MPIDIKEKQFENYIESSLISGGYTNRSTENYDRKLVLDKGLVIQFLKNSQPESWTELGNIYGSKIEDEILRELKDNLDNRSMIHVLRNGIELSHIHLDFAYFKPVSKMNPTAEIQYEKNILSIMRQVVYSENNKRSAVDLLLFINGLPLATAEIKNPATGQLYRDAIRQYEQDRDPKDKLFEFKKRTLVHFAIDPFEVHVTTYLNRDKTIFLPFNKGRNEGRGNPDNPDSYRTSYLWEEIWQKDIWLEIISNFIYLKRIEQDSGPLKEDLIFPRYHQLDSVIKLVIASKENGHGRNYLIQHSTGSGKSNTIAWLAYKLFSLHDYSDKPVFDSIIVLSDRVSIVNQLGNVIRQFEQVPGTFELVESASDLAEKLETERKILVSTQQKFPFLSEKLIKLKGKYFAIIIDEAHSSQTGEAATKVKAVLTTNLEEAAQIEAEIEQSEYDLVDLIEKQMRSRGRQANLSYYAFTATPKDKTLRIFGTPVSKERYEPFHKYSMRQAIEEGFILDILRNYSTYDGYFRIKIASEDKVVVRKKASRVLMKYVDTHHLNLLRKVEEIVEHFRTHCQPKIGGLAKAMIVASSRIQALKYKQEIDSYIASKNYTGIKTLVAFSGTIQDNGNNFTEQNVNKISTELELREKFDSREYNILVVAEKYQTGYDQPLLHTLYIDRKLRGIKVVQTLSRINRMHSGKIDSFVLDFQNTVEEVTNAYEPFYKGTSLVDRIDSTYLLRLYDKIMSFNIITINDLNQFAEIFFKPRSFQRATDHGKLYALLDPVLNRFDDANEMDKDEFKHKLIEYIEAYSFLLEIVPYEDIKLEKLFVFSRFIANKDLLFEISTQLPQLKGDVSLQYYRLQKTYHGDIPIAGDRPLIAREEHRKPNTPDVLTTLSDVVRRINEKFEGDGRLSDADEITLTSWLEDLEKDSDLRDIAKANEFEDFLRIYKIRLQEQMVNSLSDNFRLVSLIYSDPDLMNKITISAAKYYQRWALSNDLPPIRPGTPAENKLSFRRIIESCKGFLHWMDLYIGKEGLEFLVDNFDHRNVKQIKLLTSLYNNEIQINEELRFRFDQFKKELENKNISLGMKVISTKSAYNMVAHDRFIMGENVKYNVPSFTTVIKGRFSEIKKTTNDIPFIDYWNDKDSLDILKDWPKIKNILDKKTRIMYETNCSDCNKKFQVPFKPDGDRPVYCVDCRKKYRV